MAPDTDMLDREEVESETAYVSFGPASVRLGLCLFDILLVWFAFQCGEAALEFLFLGVGLGRVVVVLHEQGEQLSCLGTHRTYRLFPVIERTD